jgi:hypothetical protein
MEVELAQKKRKLIQKEKRKGANGVHEERRVR